MKTQEAFEFLQNVYDFIPAKCTEISSWRKEFNDAINTLRHALKVPQKLNKKGQLPSFDNAEEALNWVVLAIDLRTAPEFIADAIGVVRKAVEWQPMETCPTDEKVIFDIDVAVVFGKLSRDRSQIFIYGYPVGEIAPAHDVKRWMKCPDCLKPISEVE